MVIVLLLVAAVIAVMLLLRRELQRESEAWDEAARNKPDETVSDHLRS